MYDSGVRRAKNIEELKTCVCDRIRGKGNRAMGIYVKIAEFPDDITLSEVYSLVNQINADYKDEVNI